MPPERYIHRARDKAFLALLRRHGFETLAGLRLLEVGCHEGALLRSLRAYGADAATLIGIDRDVTSLRRARDIVPEAGCCASDAVALPFTSSSFDLAFAFTFFSSVLEPEARRRAAREVVRVLRPGGLLVVYDFWVNPLNRRARPLEEQELRDLFVGQRVEVERVTLAPPLVRLLRGNPAVCQALERVTALRTHLLAAVVREA
jgi:ubiquinone/menaquinone biosynthesis C-methylase UbiE